MFARGGSEGQRIMSTGLSLQGLRLVGVGAVK